MNLKGTRKKNQVSNVNIFEQQELLKKIEVVKENLTASTWRELENHRSGDAVPLFRFKRYRHSGIRNRGTFEP